MCRADEAQHTRAMLVIPVALVLLVMGIVAFCVLSGRDHARSERRLTRLAAEAYLQGGGDVRQVQRWLDAGAPSLLSRDFRRAGLTRRDAATWLAALG